MGLENSKIDDRQRAKIYKRVSFAEAKEQFAKLTQNNQCANDIKYTVADPLYTPLHTLPVSQNFHASFKGEYSGETTLKLSYAKGVEIDGKWSHSLYYLLQTEWDDGGKLATFPSVIPENYYLGLHKQQYDALYLTTFLNTSHPKKTV